MALGKGVVSTPYQHATELLADGAGILVPPHSSAALSEAVNALLDDPARLNAVKRCAYQTGRRTIWPEFAAACAALLGQVVAQHRPLRASTSVAPGMSGFLAMCDSTGMYQHAIGTIPDRRHGYCLDDNSRALILMNRAGGFDPAQRMAWSTVFAGFVQHAWNPDENAFRNFMRFNRTWCEETGSEDSNGRALWALGDTIEHSPFSEIRAWARNAFNQTIGCLDHADSPRTLAFAMLGASAVLRTVGEHEAATKLVTRGANMLNQLLEASRRPGWAWFETLLAYDNPRLSQALIGAGDAMDRPDWAATGRDTLSWICERQTSVGGHFRPVGSDTFGKQHSQLPFDQQPLEAHAAIEACLAAYRQQPEQRWLDHATLAFQWFLGRNDRGAVLGDIASGRCRDGVTPRGANENCGAESILAFHLSYYALQQMTARRGQALMTGDHFVANSRQSSQQSLHP